MHRDPDGNMYLVRAAIGKAFNLDPEKIVCGNGSDDVLSLLIQSFGGPGTELIMSAHGFSIYEIAGKLAGCVVRKAPEKNLTADIDAMLALVTDRTKMVFLANPNNPTGTLVPEPEMQSLRASLPPDVLLVIDAAYAEYVTRPDYDPGIHLVDAGDNTVMTRTFSKMFGLGGLRLGWAYAPAAIVANLNRVRSPFNVSLAAHDAGIAALAEPGWLERCRAHNGRERARVAGALREAGIGVTPSEANFVLADLGSPARADAADLHLRARGVIVRRVGGYGLPHCLRITIGLAEENAALIEALTDFAGGHP
jgi:histidinol-phosphate aminotransferase